MDQSPKQPDPPEANELPEGITAFSFEEFAGEPATTERAAGATPCGVETDLTVELSRTRMPRENARQLRTGSVVPLDNPTGDAVDVYAGGQLVARGEVVVLDGNFCVRVTELIDRMKACA